jgi:hypothetical protein
MRRRQFSDLGFLFLVPGIGNVDLHITFFIHSLRHSLHPKNATFMIDTEGPNIPSCQTP